MMIKKTVTVAIQLSEIKKLLNLLAERKRILKQEIYECVEKAARHEIEGEFIQAEQVWGLMRVNVTLLKKVLSKLQNLALEMSALREENDC